MSSVQICAVVPVYNAQETLTPLVQELTDALSHFDSHRIILVDDGSKDRSADAIKALCHQYPCVTGILLDGNFGQQSALMCGLNHADAQLVVTIDDDLEYSPGDILTLYRELEQGYDLVYGCPEEAQRGLLRSLGSKLRDQLVNRFTDKPKDVKIGSFRIVRNEIVQQAVRADTAFVYLSMELLKYTSKVAAVRVTRRAKERSNYSAASLVRLFVKLYVYYSNGCLLSRFKKKGHAYRVREFVGFA